MSAALQQLENILANAKVTFIQVFSAPPKHGAVEFAFILPWNFSEVLKIIMAMIY